MSGPYAEDTIAADVAAIAAALNVPVVPMDYGSEDDTEDSTEDDTEE